MIGNWSPGIGDPSFMGWLTVFSYYGAALPCLATALCTGTTTRKPDRVFWLAVFFFMLTLGVCKQYNLPGAITEMGRILARSDGWLGQRRIVQALLMAGVALCGTAAALFFIRKVPKPFLARHLPALACVAYLFVFVTFRAVSLHQWGAILGRTIFGLRINWISELAGICGVCLSALAYVIRMRRGRTRAR